MPNRIVTALASVFETKRTRRPWREELHPRDSKGRFIETGGVARVWGGGLARIVRALSQTKVQVSDLDGSNQRPIQTSRLTMVTRPDGTAPTKNKEKVQAEEDRRDADPRRGDGVNADDNGDPDTADAPHDRDDEGEPIGEDAPKEPRAEEENGKKPPRFTSVAAARAHLDSGAKDPRWKRPPRTHNGVHLRGASKQERAQVRLDTYSYSQLPGRDFARTSQLSADGNFLVTRLGNGKWDVYHVGSGTIMTHQAGFRSKPDALHFANELEKARDRQGRPFDWDAPHVADRLGMADGREGIDAAIGRGREADQEEQQADGGKPQLQPAAEQLHVGGDTHGSSTQGPAEQQDTPQEGEGGNGLSTVAEVLQHWRTSPDVPRQAETHNERRTREETARQRADLVQDPQVIDGFLIGRMEVRGKERWTVFHAGTSVPIAILASDKGKPDAIERVRAYRDYRDEDGQPFNWDSHRIGERLFDDPAGKRMRALTSGRTNHEPTRHENGVPDDASDVPGFPGYRMARGEDGTNVYGPDGTRIATGESAFDRNTRRSAYVGDMGDRHVSGRSERDFAVNAAQQHTLAGLPDDQKDPVWVQFSGSRALVHGADRDDPEMHKRIRRAGFVWSDGAQAYVTTSNTRPVTRALAVDTLVRGLAEDGRQIEVRRDEDRLRTPAEAPATDKPSAQNISERDLTSLSARDLEEAYTAAETEFRDAGFDNDRLIPAHDRVDAVLEEMARRDREKYGAALSGRVGLRPYDARRTRYPVWIDGNDDTDASLRGGKGRWSWNRLGHNMRYSSSRTFRTQEAALADLLAEHDRERQERDGSNVDAPETSTATPQELADAPQNNDESERQAQTTATPAAVEADNRSTPNSTGDDGSGSEQAGPDRREALADVPTDRVRGAGDGRGEGELLREARDGGERGDQTAGGADPEQAEQREVPGPGDGQDAGDGAGPRNRDARQDLPADRARDGERRAAGSRQAVAAPRFRPRSQKDLAPSGEKAKSRANVAAVKVLRDIQAEDRPATPEEQKILARWSGWGALPVVLSDKPRPTDGAFRDSDGTPDPVKYARALKRWESFAEERASMRELLSDEEWSAAQANTLNAHYTDAELVQPLWELMRELGFDGGHVLEPGSGSGNFIGTAPDNARMTGIELDPTTAAISQLLYPDARVINDSFGDVRMPNSYFDLAIGNVPFGRFPMYDEQVNPDLKHSIHDTFILKSLAKVRPGGLVALVTSRYTLDGEDDTARRQMANMADLVGAVRLPAGAHQDAAGTGVVTDVLIFRRRFGDEHTHDIDTSWVRSSKTNVNGHEIAVNEYFQRNPRNILGELTTGRGQFSDHDLTVVGDKNAGPALKAALERIRRDSFAGQRTNRMRYVPESAALERNLELAGEKHEGAVHILSDGRFTQVEDGAVIPLEVHASQQEQFRKLIALRDLTNQLLQLEGSTRETGETNEMRAQRRRLNEAYDAYVKEHGPLDKPGQTRFFSPQEAKERAKAEGLKDVPDAWKLPAALQLFEDDPASAVVFGLDKWDDTAKSATKADIFTQRVLAPREIADRAENPEQALALAMELDGGELRLPTIARLLGRSDLEALREELGPLAFDEPGTGRLISRGEYLSGNVREKLRLAERAVAADPRFAANVAALKNVIPRDLDPSEIKVKMGAPWIPESDITAFLQHILGTSAVRAEHGGGSVWEVSGPTSGIAATSDWGTKQKPAPEIAKALLEQRTLTVTRTVTVAGKKATVTDDEATSEAQAKAKEMAERFSEWVWEDPERAKRLARVYNDTFNNLVMREYDDSPLALPGANAEWKMRPHQNAAIRRIVSEPSVLLAHVVGAGKTATMVAGTQELRRTGMARKPAIIVPNHMLGQFRREYLELYPDAKLLTASSTDLTGKRRRRFIAKAATGDWDAVILTQGAFERIPMRAAAQEAYMRKELDQLAAAITSAKARGGKSLTLKRLQETLKAKEAQLKKKLAAKKDTGAVSFEDTGIDYLMVDEAHGFKNLATASHIEGASIQGSAKASDLHMKIEYLRERNDSGRVVTLATGTPIANSVTEAYIMQRYLRPDILEAAGIDDFDSWAATFGEIVQNLELAPDGSGFRMKARFSRFHNAAELLRMYRLAVDVQTAADLDLPTPTVRANAEGKRGEVVTVPISAEQKAFVTALPNQPWVRKQGGVLKAIGLASRAAIDMRLVGGHGEEGGKIDAAVHKIAEIYEENKGRIYPVSHEDSTPQKLPGSLQIVFMDAGTPGSTAKNAWDGYAHMKEQLVEAGVPADKIRFIHEAKTDKAKAKLFEDARNGRIAVLIGSTEKMGTGTNIQARAVALHHMDFPWRPADMAQREGRIERQGNLNMPEIPGTADDVRIISYVTEETFDAFKLGTLERKAAFIAQMDRKDFDAREMEDIGDVAVSFGQMKAIATGDMTVMDYANAIQDVVELQRRDRGWHRDQDTRRRTISVADSIISDLSEVLPAWREALTQSEDVSGDKFRIQLGDEEFDQRADVYEDLAARVREAARDMNLQDGARVPLGRLGGHDFHVEIGHNQFGNRIAKVRFDWPNWEHPADPDTRGVYTPSQLDESSGRGILASLERRLANLDDAIADAEATLEVAQDERVRAERGLGGSSPYGERLRSKERRVGLLSNLITANEKLKSYKGRQVDPNDEGYLKAQGRVSELKRDLGIEDTRERDIDAAAAAAALSALEDEAVTLDPADVERELAEIRPAGAARAPRAGSTSVGGGDSAPRARAAGTTTLDRDQVNNDLESIRPTATGGAGGAEPPSGPDAPQGDDGDAAEEPPVGSASPRSLTPEALQAEIVALIEHEMGHGPLTGAAKTRLTALEAEKDRRAGKRPDREPAPKPSPRGAGPGGSWAELTPEAFDGDSADDDGLFSAPAAPEAPSTAPDADNPLDRPDDVFGTPDMFADADGRDTRQLREVEIRRADKLKQGDQFTDGEGRSHTVAEPPALTGRGRVRIVTDEGRELFYRPADEFRLDAPDKPVDPAGTDLPASQQEPNPAPAAETDASEITGLPMAEIIGRRRGGGDGDPDQPETTVEPAPALEATGDEGTQTGSGTGAQDDPAADDDAWRNNEPTETAPGDLKQGDWVRVTGMNNSGGTETREGFLLADPKPKNTRQDGATVRAWRLYLSDAPQAVIRPGLGLAVSLDAAVERVATAEETEFQKRSRRNDDETPFATPDDAVSSWMGAGRGGVESRVTRKTPEMIFLYNNSWRIEEPELAGDGRFVTGKIGGRWYLFDARSGHLVELDGERTDFNSSADAQARARALADGAPYTTASSWAGEMDRIGVHGEAFFTDPANPGEWAGNPSLMATYGWEDRPEDRLSFAGMSSTRSTDDYVWLNATPHTPALGWIGRNDDGTWWRVNDAETAYDTREEAIAALLIAPKRPSDAQRKRIEAHIAKMRRDRGADTELAPEESEDGLLPQADPSENTGRDTSDDDSESPGSENEADGESDGGRERRRRERDGVGPDGAGIPDSAVDSVDGPSAGSDDDDQDDRGDGDNRSDGPGRRRRDRDRERRGRDSEGPGLGEGPGLPGLPRLPHVPARENDGRSGDRGGAQGLNGLRESYRSGTGLPAAMNTSEHRAFLRRLADNPTLAQSAGSGLVTWTDDHDALAEGRPALWHFAHARTGASVGGADNSAVSARTADEARKLADRYEGLAGADGTPFDWTSNLNPAVVRAWRDGQGHDLRQAMRAARDDFEAEQDRRDQSALPDDLTALPDADLEALPSPAFTAEDWTRFAAEMDRRFPPADRLRDLLREEPPATAAEREAENQVMDDALGFGTRDIAQAIGALGRVSAAQALRDEYEEWNQARFADAEDAMRGGSMLNREGKRRGYTWQAVFNGGLLSANDNWRRYASDELIEWFDNNGGRMTWTQYRDQARLSNRIERDRHEQEQRALRGESDGLEDSTTGTVEPGLSPDRTREEPVPAPQVAVPEARFKNVDELRDHLRAGELDATGPRGNYGMRNQLDEVAKGKKLELSPAGRLALYGGKNGWSILAPGSMELLFGADNHEHAIAYAAALESVRDHEGNLFPWDAPDAVQRARAFRGANGETLGVAVAKALMEKFDEQDRVYDRYKASQVLKAEEFLDRHHAEWRAAQERDGYTIPVYNPRDLQVGDEISSIQRNGESGSPESERGTTVNPYVSHITANAVGSGLDFPLGILSDYTANTDTEAESGRFDLAGNKIRPLIGTFEPVKLVDDPGRPRTMRRPRPGEDASQLDADRDAMPVSAPGKPNALTTRTAPDAPSVPEQAEPEKRSAPEPIDGRPAEWVSVGDLGLNDVVRITGTTRAGKPRELAGYVVQAPQRRSVSRKGRSIEMFMTLISDTPDGSSGDRSPVWTPLDASAARATGEPGTDRGDSSLITGAEGDVLSGNISDRIAADAAGRALFPGTLVQDDNGREGVVSGANASTVSVRWGDDTEEPGSAPSSLTVTDGGAARPAGWTPEGQRIRDGHVVSDRAGNLLGTVEEVDGDTAQIATRDGITPVSVTEVRPVGEVRDGETAGRTGMVNVEPTTASALNEGDVIVRDGENNTSTAAVVGRTADGDRIELDVADTRTGEVSHIDTTSDAPVTRLVDEEGQAPHFSAEDEAAEIEVRDQPHLVDPVVGDTVDPQLSPEERGAVTDHGAAPADDTDVQQAVNRLDNDLPITADQATSLADALRATSTPTTPEGRAAIRAADQLDAAAGHPAGSSPTRPAPDTVNGLGVGDTIGLPDADDETNVSAYKVVAIEDLLGGVRQVTVEDSAGARHSRTLPGDQPLWQLPALPEAAAVDDLQRDPNVPVPVEDIVAGHHHRVARDVVESAIAGTSTPGSIHQLRQQIAEQLTSDALLPHMQRARQEAVEALDAAGVSGPERAEAFKRLKNARLRARAAAVRAVLRTINDLEPLEGESQQDTASRAADLLRLIPDRIAARPAPTGSGETGEAVARHVDDALMTLARQAFGDGLNDEDALRLGRVLAGRLDATRQATARRILRHLPPAQQQRLLPQVLALLIRIGRRIIAMLKAMLRAARRAWNSDAFRRFRERLVERLKAWPESRRLHELAQAVEVPAPGDGEGLGERIAHWARLMPAPGRFGQTSRRARWYQRTTRSALGAGELPAVQDGVRWAPDRAADRGPGSAAMRHLAALRAAGGDMDQEINTRLAAARPELGDDPHTSLRLAAAYADTAERRVRDLAATPVGHSVNPDYALELAAARAEATDARREADRLRSAYTAAVPDVVAEALASVREMGPGGASALVVSPGSDSAAAQAVSSVQRFIPRDWLAPADRRLVHARDAEVGGYDAAGRMVSVADLGDGGLGTAAFALLTHLQQAQPDLMAAQEVYRYARTHTGRIGARRSSVDALYARLFSADSEQAAILPRALQSLFNGDWYEDDDLRAFLLGLLATR
ncbi:DEAD/DEAH box helicase family protein (plasmid) [Streptomyces sp. NBC_01278]|uniref:DEAD/DEAH box helicase family protein n=1 Tax=Streptomyces sp. NBC_01278 TaxID=2903809 RepID=UPI002E350EA6|nr:DEAD/DEAH box helicase family protein [Streptomyces sp. NBC_01278]